MSTASISVLQRKLEREVAWRKKEISNFRIEAMQSEPERYHFFRAGLVLIYAHWEGYLKKGAQLYIDHVMAQKLRIRELADNFVALIFFNDVKQAAEADYPGSELHHVKLAKKFLNGLDDECSGAGGWKTSLLEQNLGTTTMNKLFFSIGLDSRLGLDVAQWDTTRVFIDEQLVYSRHCIAHGEYHKIDKVQFLERSQRVLDLIDRFTDAIVCSAIEERYRQGKTLA